MDQSAAVGDVAALVNDVNAFGPGSVRVIGGVAHVVDSEGQGNLNLFVKSFAMITRCCSVFGWA